MGGAEIPHAIELLVGLLALAALVAIIARPLRLPDTVALVIAGLVIGIGASVTGYPPIEVAPELVLIVLLPGLTSAEPVNRIGSRAFALLCNWVQNVPHCGRA